ncbi:MAG: hypothetical protein IPH18_06730 [Chitinophagaceae bacterium]|nr:hypothetical protein [Chitinophagaceae bacterium]
MPPVETAENEAISFRFISPEKPNKLVAELFSHNYLPEYKKAVQHFKNEIAVDAIVNRISPYGIYLNLFDEKVQAKLPFDAETDSMVKPGDIITVLITHLTNIRIVVKRVSQ